MTEAQITECMERNRVTRAWTVAMLEPPMQFTHGYVAATPELAERRAAEVEQEYDLLEGESDEQASGNYLEEEVAEMRHPDW